MVNTRSGMVLKFLKATKTYQWTLGTQELTYMRSKPGIGTSLDSTKPYNWTLLSNSSPKSKVQTSVLGLGVDFVFPLSQQGDSTPNQWEKT